MPETDILMISIVALSSVFLVLVILSLLMRLILLVFPEKEIEDDSCMFAAIHSAYSVNYPGVRITIIEELK